MSGEYPTDSELITVEEWEFKHPDSFEKFMAYVRGIGHWWPDEKAFGWSRCGRLFEISTGGWSGNEAILISMKRNTLFWMVCWIMHRRGGHYTFEIPDPAVYFKEKLT